MINLTRDLKQLGKLNNEALICFLIYLDECERSLTLWLLFQQIKQNRMEFGSTADYHNAKNRRRLIQQNIRLKQQLDQIQAQVSVLTESSVEEVPEDNSQYKELLQEVAMQERLMKQLRARIEGFRLQRAKDNVEYIIHEEDDLKIAKQVLAKLIDERDVLTKRRCDKKQRLTHNLPYQNYEKQFLQGLTQVVHHNREQAAQVTQIEREIRKYHLAAKNSKPSSTQTALPSSSQDIQQLQKQINDKQEQRRVLERQWKPHLDRLDEQYAKLLKQLGIKKETVGELERQQRSWTTRMMTVRSPEAVKEDRKRVSQIVINPKLKQQLEDYLISEEEKKKKKVNNQELKYQFTSTKEEQQKNQKVKKQDEIVPFPISLAKKKEEKIIETMHDDKNISKKVQKTNTNNPKKGKVDQMHNTDLSLPVKSEDLSLKASKQKMPSEDKNSVRLWQPNPQFKQEKSVKDPPKDGKNNVLYLKQISISTQSRNWNKPQQ